MTQYGIFKGSLGLPKATIITFQTYLDYSYFLLSETVDSWNCWTANMYIFYVDIGHCTTPSLPHASPLLCHWLLNASGHFKYIAFLKSFSKRSFKCPFQPICLIISSSLFSFEMNTFPPHQAGFAQKSRGERKWLNKKKSRNLKSERAKRKFNERVQEL